MLSLLLNQMLQTPFPEEDAKQKVTTTMCIRQVRKVQLLARIFAYALSSNRVPSKIMGWRVSTSKTIDFAMDALSQAICQRDFSGDLLRHSSRGSQNLSIH